ncbi:FkbM family methyltransferase [Chitinibacter sp. SCUT-21]|uniref:FkbM family methyltransferase n=1 Tax=Chitinibacter sp. SCUT-21 TaxID=2970891 RepID=UPI0035A6A7A8
MSNHTSRFLELWGKGDWESLIKEANAISLSDIDKVRTEDLLVFASAFIHKSNFNQAHRYINFAKKHGINTQVVTNFLLLGVKNSLAKIRSLQSKDEQAALLFKEATQFAVAHVNNHNWPHQRASNEMRSLGLLPQAIKLNEKLLNSTNSESDHTPAIYEIIKSEISLLHHELSLAVQRSQLYQSTNYRENEKSDLTIEERLKNRSLSQLGQDLWVLKQTNYKREGFFVEFGATDGVLLSNSFLLEKEFDWKGICAEPNPIFYAALEKNRSCIKSNACIGATTGEEVEFIFADVFGGMEKHAENDGHKDRRNAYKRNGQSRKLVTISLHDFLLEKSAPTTIDYLSIDTEGSEYEILASFPFDKWDVRNITVEHNFTQQREMIFELLTNYGYQRTEAKWDDWYTQIKVRDGQE